MPTSRHVKIANIANFLGGILGNLTSGFSFSEFRKSTFLMIEAPSRQKSSGCLWLLLALEQGWVGQLLMIWLAGREQL